MSDIQCPRCGEQQALETLAYLDDDGRAMLRVTCPVVVHEEPIVFEIPDPSAPKALSLGSGEGVVHDLDLYNKLESVVLKLDGPHEYGVVEHLFAYEYPEEYAALWKLHGHVATHGQKQYTLSAYLGLLLGNLSRHGSVAHSGTTGTGRWSYNDGISAWANPHRKDGPIISWAEWATANGIDPGDWPALELLPDRGSLARNDRFWVYTNRPNDKAKVHRASCSYCNDGEGIHSDAGDENGEWLGPF